MDAADAAKDVNLRVGRIGRGYDPAARLSFLCECGCLEQVELDTAEYDAAGGAWVEGHREHPTRAKTARAIARRESFRSLDAIQRAESLQRDAAALKAEARQIIKRIQQAEDGGGGAA